MRHASHSYSSCACPAASGVGECRQIQLLGRLQDFGPCGHNKHLGRPEGETYSDSGEQVGPRGKPDRHDRHVSSEDISVKTNRSSMLIHSAIEYQQENECLVMFIHPRHWAQV